MTPLLHLITRPRLLWLLSALLLAACAGTPPAPKAPTPAPKPVLPAVVLDQSLLYDILLGEVALQRGYEDVAVDAMARVAMASKDPRAVARAARVALRNKQYSQALSIARLWRQQAPKSPEPLGIIAVSQLQLGRIDAAEKTLQLQLEAGRKNLKQAYRRLAVSMLQVAGKKPELAMRMMKKMVDLHPGLADAWLMLALVAERAKQRPAVLQALEQALRVRPDWEDAALGKFSHLVRYRSKEAEPFITDWLNQHPDSAKIQMAFGHYLLKKNRKKAALQAFERAVKVQPDDADANYAAALLSFQTRQFTVAIDYLQQTLRLRSNDPMLQIMLGQSYAAEKKYQPAMQIFSQVKGDKPAFQARLLSAEVLLDQKKPAQAMALLNQTTTSSNSQEIQLILEKDQLFRKLKDWQSTKKMLDKAIAQHPKDNRLLYARGLAAAELHLVDLVERDMRLLIRREPNNAQAYNSLGYTLADQTDRYTEALELLKKANTLLPQDPFVLDSLGWLYFRMGQSGKAAEFLQQALTLRQDPEISAHLGEVLWSIGQQGKARDVWQKAYRQASDNSVLNATIKRFNDH